MLIKTGRKAPRASGIWAVLAVVLAILSTPEAEALADDQIDGNEASGSWATKIQEAEALTQTLVGLALSLARVEAGDRVRIHDRMVVLAAQRKGLLAELTVEDPAEVLRLSLPVHLRDAMPFAVRQHLERQVEIEGALEVIYIDAEDPSRSRLVYFLETYDGERISLHFAKEPPAVHSGTDVRAKGLLLEGPGPGDVRKTAGSMVLESGDGGLLVLGDGGDPIAARAAALELNNTFGEQKTVVIMVNFQDKPNETPWAKAEVNNLVFGDTNDFLLENSYGQTWLTGDVFGWYTIAMDSTECASGIDTLANQAATNAGVNLSAYDRFIYLYPKNACGYTGKAQLGAFPSKAWINGSFRLRTFAHELGHNLGLRHAHFKECGDVTLSDSCTSIEYGDTVDAMGYPNAVGHFNAFAKVRLGWLGHGASPPITDAGSTGTYTIAPSETQDADVKAVRILHSTNPDTGRKTSYYLEYRQFLGFDTLIASSSPADTGNVFNGAIVHLGTESSGNSSFLLDMTPGSYASVDARDAALEVGQSYTDSSTGVTITPLTAGPAGLEVRVDFGDAPTCEHVGPNISLSPAESQWVAPGTAVTYTLTVTNNDSDACSTSSFDLLAAVPAGWSAIFGVASLNLAPGASDTTSLEVTSPTSAADGFYDVTVTAENAADATASGGATATYVVSAPINDAPIAANDAYSTAEDVALNVAAPGVLVNDNDADGDPITALLKSAPANGTLALNADGSFTYAPNADYTGSDSFTYVASDGSANSNTATVNITVSAVNDAPVAVDDSAATDAAVAITIAVLANDGDPDGDTLSVVSVLQGANGSVMKNADNTVTYAPAAGFAGTDSFGYTVSDGQGGSADAIVTVVVDPVTQRADILWRHAETGNAVLWLMNGFEREASESIGEASTVWRIRGRADLDGDTGTDVLWRNTSTGNILVWLMDGFTRLAATGIGATGLNWQMAGTDDFDGDGRADILWRDTSTGNTLLWLMDGFIKLASETVGAPSLDWRVVGVGDLDGDRRADILWRNTQNGSTLAWLMDGSARLAEGGFGKQSNHWQVEGLGDFDGDGRADILWRNAKNGRTLVWRMDGLTTVASAAIGTVKSPWEIAQLGDFDGDGRSDILWRNTDNGNNIIWQMNGLVKEAEGGLGFVPLEWEVQ
jgi:VCBS repeat-containing protein